MGLLLHDYQTTVKSRATLAGIGVHSGKTVTVHFLPADADTGIVFHLSNGGEARELRALVAEVGATDLC
ncbi:UDP-3-O-acyl-N-acetylglucosamine deacetylase, partial [Mesorhizobium sp. B2-9-1]